MPGKNREVTVETTIGAQRLKQMRLDHGKTQEEIAVLLGITKSTYSRYESGDLGDMGSPKIKKLSGYYGVNPAWVMGLDVPKYIEEMTQSDIKLIPLYGNVACGSPILATENNIESFVATDADDKATFCLVANGDSMTGARIMDGDILFVREQNIVDNGAIAVVIIESHGEYEATVKRFYRYGDTVVLRPENPAYEEMTFKKGEINRLRVIGKVISFKSEVV